MTGDALFNLARLASWRCHRAPGVEVTVGIIFFNDFRIEEKRFTSAFWR